MKRSRKILCCSLLTALLIPLAFLPSTAAATGVPAPVPDPHIIGEHVWNDGSVFPERRCYVDASATGANNGKSWADAFTDLQDALAKVIASDSIWVAAGTYKPTSGIDRTVSFRLVSGVALYGGFAGTETLLSERDWVANETILSGDIGVEADSTDNSSCVVVADSTVASGRFDGFTITEAVAASVFGSAMGCDDATLTLANLVFVNNFSVYRPGGLWVVEGSVALSGVTFSENRGVQGGGMGGWGSCVLTDVTFSGNDGGPDGGGLYWYFGELSLTNVSFSGNSASQMGGGLFINDGNVSLTDVSFAGNTTTSVGASFGGGGLCCQFGDVSLTNVSFSGNSSNGVGGAILLRPIDPHVSLINTVLWGNSAAQGGPEIYCYDADPPTISYSLVQGCGGSGAAWVDSLGVDGGDNLDADPLFVDGPGGDLRLSGWDSPAFNAGSNTAPGLPPTDLDGNDRIAGGTVDLGAYEYPVACPPGNVLYVDASATGAGDGSSWADAFTDMPFALKWAQCTDTEIWVAAGTYYPTADGSRDSTLKVVNGAALYGGFAGTETERSERDWVANPTILSGDIGVEADSTDNSYTVVTCVGVDSTTVLDGFTITKGTASPGGVNPAYAAGMVNRDGSPTLSNVTFSENLSLVHGASGGMYNEDGNPTLTNVQFVNNTTSREYGGGMTNYGGSPTLTNVLFWGNKAGNIGANAGGMWSENGSPTLTNVVFANNTGFDCGGMICYGPATLVNTVSWGNVSWVYPPGAICGDGAATISYSLIEGCGGSGAGWDASLGIDGGNNLDADPLFTDLLGGDLRLLVGSPAINAGNSAAPNLPATDLDGNPRIVGAAVDMGPYEYQSGGGAVAVVPVVDTPVAFGIASVAPNPFGPRALIHYGLPQQSQVGLRIYDVSGRLVRELVGGEVVGPGRHEAIWNGRNDGGRRVAAGIYFCRLSAGDSIETKRLVLLR